ncbi:MAG: preprotein translocase subunit Tim44 [Desulfobulbaceae bacterium BRH_c16a]|nr:MAG: preprotein translocase subunit Tim44 [Desulfobulbaceae bacterium BRH_c16a]
MTVLLKRFAPIFLMLIAFTLIEGGLMADYADARSKSGGKSFSSSPSKAPASAPAGAPATGGGFGRGMMGGLLGGAIGGMLFGSMFGGGGSGMGILPLLILGGVAFFLYRRFAKARQGNQVPVPVYSRQGVQSSSTFGGSNNIAQPPPPLIIGENLVGDGISRIQQTDRDFDPAYFIEVASDVFFKVQAGWMRRELDSYRHLLGEQLAQEYEEHFVEMRSIGHINKLESIAVRGVEIIQAGSDGCEDFVTVLFTANLLDYTVDDKSGELVSGSMTNPVKFQEEWTWARSTGTQNWKLEGIKES